MKIIGIALALIVLVGCATKNPLPQPTGDRIPVNKQ